MPAPFATVLPGLALALVLPAQDGWKDLKGDWVPELKVITAGASGEPKEQRFRPYPNSW